MSRGKQSGSGGGFEECPAEGNYHGKDFKWERGAVTWLASNCAMLFEELVLPL